MAATELKLATNVPEIIAFMTDDGKEFPSNYENSPARVRFDLVDGRMIYLPKPFVESIKNNGIGARTPFEIVKREVANGKTQLQFRPLVAQLHKNEKAAPAVAPPSAAPSQPAVQSGKDKQHSNGTAPPRYSEATQLPTLPSAPLTPQSTRFMAAYKDAIDVLLEARTYAQRQGLAIEIRCEDVRCLAATIMIDAKGGR